MSHLLDGTKVPAIKSLKAAPGRRPLPLAAPGTDPGLDVVMSDTLAAIERGHGALDTRDLPFVEIGIVVKCLRGERRLGASGAPGELLQAFFEVGFEAHGKGCRGHGLPIFARPPSVLCTS